jgi:hypothetical protein
VSTFSSPGINLLAPHALHLSLRPAMGTFPSASARDIPAGADEMIVTKPPPTPAARGGHRVDAQNLAGPVASNPLAAFTHYGILYFSF